MTAASAIRRSELLAALSLAIDLGLGQPMEHMLRSSLIATRLADELGLDPDQRDTVYYANLFTWIGCHADSTELAHLFGDDLAFRADTYQVDLTGLPFLSLMLSHAARGRPLLERATRAASFLVAARAQISRLIRSHCTSAGALARELGLDERVGEVLGYSFERWDGGGLPAGVGGESFPVEMDVVHVADVAEVHLRTGGSGRAIDVVQSRRGTQFAPQVADIFVRRSSQILDGLLEVDVWDAALAQAPDGDRRTSDTETERLLVAMGDFVDLKCPSMLGHSRGVARIAAGAGQRLGLPASQVTLLRWAGHVHDLGRMGVSNQVWEKPGPLSAAEWERVRLHPYLTGRILGRVRGLEQVALVAAAHHERLDGSGYPHGVPGSSLTVPQRVLAAADVYEALHEPRPYRPARNEHEVTSVVLREARAGRLDTDAAEAVLDAPGVPGGRRKTGPSGLTAREVDVLRMVAQGRSNRQIAEDLVISEKTVRNHVEHVYAKLGVSNRVGASLFAINHGIAGTAET